MAFLKTGASMSGSVGSGGSANMANPATGGAGTIKGWHPTVVYMLGFIVLEIVLVGFLSRHLFGGD